MSVSEGVGVRKWETMTNIKSFLTDLGFLEVGEDYSSLRFFLAVSDVARECP